MDEHGTEKVDELFKGRIFFFDPVSLFQFILSGLAWTWELVFIYCRIAAVYSVHIIITLQIHGTEHLQCNTLIAAVL